MKIFAATGNKHKKQELSQLFAPHQIVIPSDFGIDFSPEENGSSFVANSLIKAETLWNIVNEPVLADDSGICVDILDGRPGIYSARYAGKNAPATDDKLSSLERNMLLLEEAWEKAEMLGIPEGTPLPCRFVCAMVLYLGKDRFLTSQETIEGQLVRSMDDAAGAGGFGYDPVVYLPEYGKTIAELTAEEKNRISHRGKACANLKKLLDSLIS